MTVEMPAEVAEQLEKGAQYLRWWLNDKDSDSIRLQRERAHRLRQAGDCFKSIIDTLRPDKSLLLTLGETAIHANRWGRNPYDFTELKSTHTIKPGEKLAFEGAEEESVPYLYLEDDAEFRESTETNLSCGLLSVPMSELAKALAGSAVFEVVTLEEGRAVSRRH